MLIHSLYFRNCLYSGINFVLTAKNFLPMKKLLLLLPLIFPILLFAQGSVHTTYSESYDRWDVSIGGASGTISTTYSESYDNWDISIGGKSYKLRTTYSNSYDNWELSGGDLESTIKIRTTYSNSYDNWDADGTDDDFRITTTYSKSYDNWSISGDLSKEEAGVKAAVAFIPVFVAAIYNKGLTE